MDGAVVYCRVSTKEQTHNLSLATQQRGCGDYCRRLGWEVVKVFVEEGESAKTADRIELQRMLTFCSENRKRVRFVVVYDLSRFSRAAHDHHALRAFLLGLGISLRSATQPIDETSSGKFMESILSSMAQFENDVKSERTAVGMKAALALGRWTFQAPLGYLTGQRDDARLRHDPDRAPLVLDAFTDFATGKFTKRDLLRRLARKGLRNRTGMALSPQTFDALLRNRLYAGWVVVRKWDIATRGDFEAIVPEALFEQVQARLDGRGREAPARRVRIHPDFPLRGFVFHDKCGKPLTASWSRGRTKRYPYYHCRACRGVGMSKDGLEGAFRELLTRLQPRPEFMRLFDSIVLDAWRQRQADSRLARASQEAEIATLKNRLDELDAAFLWRHSIDQQTYGRQRDRLRQDVALAEMEFEEARQEEIDVEGLLAFAGHVLTNAERLWERGSLDQKQRLQRTLFPEGVTFDGARIGTAVTCLAFAQLPQSVGQETGLASPTGFEPVSPP